MDLKSAIEQASVGGEEIKRANWQQASIQILNFAGRTELCCYGQPWAPTYEDILAADWELVSSRGRTTEPHDNRTVEIQPVKPVKEPGFLLPILLSAATTLVFHAVLQLLGWLQQWA